ncbi:MAG: cyclic pyranopterin phosphate synthase [Thermosynechococcus sp.]|uniref:GTP 3',8-cyclase MoaA n=1 Tax=Thermosynechococcus sp. TaxID=2814275 RepID=UPI002200B4A3|nr:GTP 3',8-cyclase MoaA [Thermosynechococcus sp.]BCX12254.1 MAG: cyclic pyranopterin phosphate synthase [Thermosynechococcus sp.]
MVVTAAIPRQRLVDAQGRQIRKLRLSVTDRCNLRCTYCMPLDAAFMPTQTYLTPVEYATIVAELVELGIESVRLTGGEPLLRAEFPEIVAALAAVGVPELSLTTNGIRLIPFLPLLDRYGVRRLNISLDSLDPQTFAAISHGHHLETVKEAIATAADQGFQVKLNMVVMAGVNDHELVPMVEYAKALGVEVRFLELMRIGYACHLGSDRFVSAATMLEHLRQYYDLRPVPRPQDSTSFNFETACGAQIGFIASESQPFCGHCSRWRLSADGVLRACLFKEAGISLRGLSKAERYAAYGQVLGMKPSLRSAEVHHAMHQIGG